MQGTEILCLHDTKQICFFFFSEKKLIQMRKKMLRSMLWSNDDTRRLAQKRKKNTSARKLIKHNSLVILQAFNGYTYVQFVWIFFLCFYCDFSAILFSLFFGLWRQHKSATQQIQTKKKHKQQTHIPNRLHRLHINSYLLMQISATNFPFHK